MKKLFERMKSYSFWISFSGALVLFINCIGKIFNFQIDNKIVEDVVMSIAGLLVVLGFITKETKNSATSNENDENFENKNLENKNLEDEDLSNENLNTNLNANLNDINLEDKNLSNENVNDEKLKAEKHLDGEATFNNSQDGIVTQDDIGNKTQDNTSNQMRNEKDKQTQDGKNKQA